MVLVVFLQNVLDTLDNTEILQILKLTKFTVSEFMPNFHAVLSISCFKDIYSKVHTVSN